MKPLAARLTKPALFAWLMAFSLVLVVLPPGAKRWMTGLLQPIGWIEWIFTGTAQSIREIVSDAAAPPLTAEASEQLRERVAALDRQLAHLYDENTTLRLQIDTLTGLHNQIVDARAIIHIVSVASGSANPRRRELIINGGDFRGIRAGDWVAAAPPRDTDLEASGRELVARQWLIGKVTDALPYQSRVRLLIDSDFGPEKVIPARRLPNGSLQRAEQEVLLYGEGGEMLIKGVSRNFFEDGFNLIIAPIGPLGGSGMIAGEIFASQSRTDTAQRIDLRARPIGDATTLSTVYVISPGR
ncbi:MAG: rod shape-determining protein MreC [Phycisphaerae bacterium]